MMEHRGLQGAAAAEKTAGPSLFIGSFACQAFEQKRSGAKIVRSSAHGLPLLRNNPVNKANEHCKPPSSSHVLQYTIFEHGTSSSSALAPGHWRYASRFSIQFFFFAKGAEEIAFVHRDLSSLFRKSWVRFECNLPNGVESDSVVVCNASSSFFDGDHDNIPDGCNTSGGGGGTSTDANADDSSIPAPLAFLIPSQLDCNILKCSLDYSTSSPAVANLSHHLTKFNHGVSHLPQDRSDLLQSLIRQLSLDILINPLMYTFFFPFKSWDHLSPSKLSRFYF
nr:hypothetical protein Iba_chr04bCG18700 [Ipomoea batatas]